jgi:anti-sigma B factor antagonist
MNETVRMEEEPQQPRPAGGAESRSHISSEPAGPDAVVIRVAGEFDMLTASPFHDALWPRLDTTGRTVVLDLTEVGFLGSSGLAELVAARDTVTRAGGSLVLVADGRTVLRPLEVTGLLHLFPVHDSVEAALREV